MYTLPAEQGNDTFPLYPDYNDLTSEGKRDNRKALLGGWWDRERYGVLIADHTVFLHAFFFYVAYYIKRCQYLKPYYYRKSDCEYKRQFIELLKSRRFLTIAPRGSTKTYTLIYEMCPFVAQFRPQTEILIGGENWDMTSVKILECKKRIEKNELIEAEFGKIHPGRSTGYRWNSECLEFLNGSMIGGSSIEAATRGRHPLLGLLDDPEGKKSRKSAVWRKDFMEWVSKDYINQFDDHGAVVGWIGTILSSMSCLHQAFHDMDSEGKYKNWSKRIMKMVYQDPVTGDDRSAWPEKLTVAEFHAKMQYKESGDPDAKDVTVIGRAAVMAEFQGEPVPSGERMFIRDERRHGYMIYKDSTGMLMKYDPLTRESVHYVQWIDNLYKYGGVDVADTEESSADWSAIIVWGIDQRGHLFILDAWEAQVWSEKTTRRVFAIGNKWGVLKFGWEAGAFGNRIIREAIRLRKEYKAKGLHVAKFEPVSTGGLTKPVRIERMQADWEREMIHLPLLEEIDGLKPHRTENVRHIGELIAQIDLMTEEGTGGKIDLLDAAEMGHRVIGNKPKTKVRANPDHLMLDKFKRDLGVEFDPSMLKPNSWTPEMIKEMWQPTHDSYTGRGADPYE